MKTPVEPRILTLFITRDETTFNPVNYGRVLQQPVNQKVYVVSARPVPFTPNLVVRVDQRLPLPVRVGVSVNSAIRSTGLNGFTHVFKVDGDNLIPADYLPNLLRKKTPVSGCGSAMLIETGFFRNAMRGRYPVAYCDDLQAFCLARALGVEIGVYDGEEKTYAPDWGFTRERTFILGTEWFRWGETFMTLLYRLPSLVIYNAKMGKYSRGLKAWVYEFSGWLHAKLNGYHKHEYAGLFSRNKKRFVASKIFKLLRLFRK